MAQLAKDFYTSMWTKVGISSTHIKSWAWWHMPEMLAPGKQRQEDFQGCGPANLAKSLSSRFSWETLSQKIRWRNDWGRHLFQMWPSCAHGGHPYICSESKKPSKSGQFGDSLDLMSFLEGQNASLPSVTPCVVMSFPPSCSVLSQRTLLHDSGGWTPHLTHARQVPTFPPTFPTCPLWFRDAHS